ncbi:DUF6113 family protein [Thermasporomyces composti]|jgi:hypothetical protein|uniref:Uncharacterized protein n=1 Tax=Thermasporomyces composti TaxID=696763 RepID=A0A3D9V242_THECX|nr:DUF6113 family protein [Thermasporomyces composti]REF35587.1 hypothetical protein DFJ64_0968 [Thermasporomyces composti]
MSRVVRALGVLALVLLGACVGALGIVVSRMTADVAAVPVPYGFVLAVAAVAALVAEGRRALGVAGALGAALGWSVPVVLAMGQRPEGDVVLAGDGYGVGYVVLGLVAVVWNVARGLASAGPSDT